MPQMDFAFVTVTDYCFFPGTLATVNSILHYHPKVPVYVVQNDKHALSPPQESLLRAIPEVKLLNSINLTRQGRYINAWELKAYAAHDLCDEYDVLVGIDSDCVLCGPVDDQVRQACASREIMRFFGSKKG